MGILLNLKYPYGLDALLQVDIHGTKGKTYVMITTDVNTDCAIIASSEATDA